MAPAFHLTRGRIAAKQAHALRAGASVSATLVAATGPKSHVTGARTTPTSGPEVFERRLAPCGTLTAPEKNTLCAWAMAQAGQAMNQTSCAGSPHPQVSSEEGWPDQTCHHRRTAGTVKKARARRWKPTVRTTRWTRPGASYESTVLHVGRCTSLLNGVAAAGLAGAGVVHRVRRHVHPTRHRRRAYRRPSRQRGQARRVRMIEDVPAHRRCVVVGAGLLGLSAAWALTRRGWSVQVLEAAGATGPRAVGLQGRRPHLPSRLPRAALRGDGRPGAPALARARGRNGSAPAPRHRPGDVGRRGDAARHRRRPGGRRRTRRAGPAAHGGPALSRDRRGGTGPGRTRLRRPGRRRMPGCAPPGRRLRAPHRLPRDVAAPVLGFGHRGDGGGGHPRGRRRRRLRRPGRARAPRRRHRGPGRSVSPPGGLLRRTTRRRLGPAHLH